MSELENAWSWREQRGMFEGNGAVRVFHGPGEGSGPLAHFAIDRFADSAGRGEHYWITRWEKAYESRAALESILGFFESKGAASAVALSRPEKGVPEEPQALLGEAPRERFEISELGARYWIQCLGARHPGLFLDHLPLRRWLRERARGWSVLNTFAYTGSLSVAAGLGGASHVTTLDLSNPTVSWAEANWKLNGLEPGSARFISGDVFEWLPRLRREGRRFDCVILDPPSFSRGKKGMFSTSKDLARLHEAAMDVLAEGGILVTSINSAQISWEKYERDVLAAAREKKLRFEVLMKIDLPESFPTRLGAAPGGPGDRYLKGWILKSY